MTTVSDAVFALLGGAGFGALGFALVLAAPHWRGTPPSSSRASLTPSEPPPAGPQGPVGPNADDPQRPEPA